MSLRTEIEEALAQGHLSQAARLVREFWADKPTLANHAFVLRSLDQLGDFIPSWLGGAWPSCATTPSSP